MPLAKTSLPIPRFLGTLRQATTRVKTKVAALERAATLVRAVAVRLIGLLPTKVDRGSRPRPAEAPLKEEAPALRGHRGFEAWVLTSWRPTFSGQTLDPITNCEQRLLQPCDRSQKQAL